MTIRMDELIKVISTALDLVEGELLGASPNHGKRIAVLCSNMGSSFGMVSDELTVITTCALFHDNALTEYILSERPEPGQELNMRLHCQYGQRNIEVIPFKADVSDIILYHHERADGFGPFGKREGKFPLGAELVAIADTIDANRHLQRLSPNELPSLREWIAGEAGGRFTERAVKAVLSVLDEAMLLSLRDDRIHETAARAIPIWEADMESEAVMRLAWLVTQIIDYKSTYTRKHSEQIANRSGLMCGYYGFDGNTRAQVYLAAALHDIGKLSTPTAILEKPGKLDDDEFETIKQHAKSTYDLLSGISGLEDVCKWASNHHEKLDGMGYPFGKVKNDLDFMSRLLCCLDIYQAVSEERPYHPGRNHEDTMPILYDMARKGLIDGHIVKDIDAVMGEYSGKDVPPPIIEPGTHRLS